MLWGLAPMLIAALCATGCRSQKETSRTESQQQLLNSEQSAQLRHLADSVYQWDRDSVWVETKGDTVKVVKTIYRYKYKQRADTVVRTDTVTVIATAQTTQSTEKKKSSSTAIWWWLLLAAAAVLAAIIAYKKYK